MSHVLDKKDSSFDRYVRRLVVLSDESLAGGDYILELIQTISECLDQWDELRLKKICNQSGSGMIAKDLCACLEKAFTIGRSFSVEPVREDAPQTGSQSFPASEATRVVSLVGKPRQQKVSHQG